VQDCGHLCRASEVAAVIEIASVPLSVPARRAGLLSLCVTGGDDYELLLAVPPAAKAALLFECARAGVPVTRIGDFAEGLPEVTVLDAAGVTVSLQKSGWSHF
jgi:thiamine-monophosphate kinase